MAKRVPRMNVVLHTLAGAPVATFEGLTMSKATKLFEKVAAKGYGDYDAEDLAWIAVREVK